MRYSHSEAGAPRSSSSHRLRDTAGSLLAQETSKEGGTSLTLEKLRVLS